MRDVNTILREAAEQRALRKITRMAQRLARWDGQRWRDLNRRQANKYAGRAAKLIMIATASEP